MKVAMMRNIAERSQIMTQIQVDYQKFVETQRHNKAMEQVSQVEAAAATSQAQTRAQEVKLAAEYQPYKIAETTTKAAEHGMKAAESGAKGLGALIAAIAALFA